MYFWDKHKTITSYYELLSGEVCDRYELTQMEYDILMFLHNNPQHNTAADIVKVRNHQGFSFICSTLNIKYCAYYVTLHHLAPLPVNCQPVYPAGNIK